ncbi:MAG TPA: formyltetrahydrofolate deformylase [Candidatus Saccharimonadales bacterium]|nr:formyltetrahydrofolate deformylase [Candidatus Saccharimonadales bacterium]
MLEPPAIESDIQLLLIECQDEPGLIHKITGVLLRHRFNIIRNDEFVDETAARFFMRTEFTGSAETGPWLDEMKAVLPSGASVRLANPGNRSIVILATREHHCVAELLVRNAYRELGAKVLAVISNYNTLAPLVRQFGIPFEHVSHAQISREEHESALAAALDRYAPDYIVLAKYMRILSGGFVGRYVRRMINIHHSFLPAFIGAEPYQQAFARGVKIIGATAHFVTEELDDGPISCPDTFPVDHTHSARQMAQTGRDIEKLVLARGLRLVLEERVFLSGNRTIIFD